MPPQAETSEPDPAPHAGLAPTGAPPSRHARGLGRRVWLVGGGATVALVVAGGITAATVGLFDTIPETATTPVPLGGTPVPANTVHASGIVDDLGTKEGLDFDTGQRQADQYAPGVDISFSSKSTHLDAHHERVSYVVLPEPVPAERRYCEQDTEWVREYKNVHDVTEGRAVCVKTDEGRLSMMVITKRATNVTGTISLRFVTWP